jgi:hypothetical protein
VVFLYTFLRNEDKNMGMNFKEAFKLMKQGAKVKLPSWGGYWY